MIRQIGSCDFGLKIVRSEPKADLAEILGRPCGHRRGVAPSAKMKSHLNLRHFYTYELLNAAVKHDGWDKEWASPHSSEKESMQWANWIFVCEPPCRWLAWTRCNTCILVRWKASRKRWDKNIIYYYVAWWCATFGFGFQEFVLLFIYSPLLTFCAARPSWRDGIIASDFSPSVLSWRDGISHQIACNF